ncbi:hypothetical protein FYK55_10600 [Roseiconus nitratireducens]|uniref:Sulfotransferase family protein n=1 Tax=Roseiconus nitratireducens TaxID=2605748 RepID=A0A5M6DC45_9BACT|nr:hypothetical protein [Roseiconus nitratireducens]KAA5543649.1 hypothetical protein FYK55_10600 [Roseiconus nitratireducens]
MHPIVLTISTGRCGTTFLDSTFRLNFASDQNWISHEHLKQGVTRVGQFHRCYEPDRQAEMVNETIEGLLRDWVQISQTGPVVDFGWTMRSLIPYFRRQLGDQLKVLYVHRHPVAVAASFKLIGSYSIYQSPQWSITPHHPSALFPQFASRWDSMTAFEKCLYLWLEVNAYAAEVRDRYPDMEFLEATSADLFREDGTLEQIARFTGFSDGTQPLERSNRHNKRDIFLLERRPIRDEWERYQRHPELIAFAESLGYNMDRDHIAGFIGKYQLPPGLIPLLRNRSGYWAHKENAGRLMRRLGLRN